VLYSLDESGELCHDDSTTLSFTISAVTITILVSRSVCCCQEMEALEELMKTVDGSKYSVHASSILESHDTSEPVTVAASASAKVHV